MRFLSTFAGIGGLDKGLEDAGWECAGQVEIDAACQYWLGVHWPHVPKWSDIKTLTGDAVRSRIGTVDALVGGPPCQPASVAGKRLGSADDRWLWPDFLRLGRELSCKWILAENPPGIVTLKPHGLDWILEELEAAGYQPFPVIVGSDDVGAPHRRKRVWIVAYRDGERREGLDALLQPRGSFEDRAEAAWSGQGMADSARGGRGADGRAPRDAGHPDISEPPVGSPTGEGLEGQRPDARQPEEPEPRHSMRWPSRPGEPQHAWEAPRLAHTANHRRNGRAGSGAAGRDAEAGHGTRPEGGGESGMADSPSEPPRRPGQPRQEPDSRLVESEMGEFADGVPAGLAGFTSAHRREALKALGNSVNPWNAFYLGRAIQRIAQERVA